MYIWLGNEEYEVQELITLIESDIVSIEAVIEKLVQEKELKASALKVLRSMNANGCPDWRAITKDDV